MSEVSEIREIKSVIVVGTMKYVITEVDWYYNACKRCNTKIESKWVDEVIDGNVVAKKVLFCKTKDCNDDDLSFVPRFKLPIKVQDSTGSLSLTILDHQATKLLGITTSELLDNLLESGNPLALPDRFCDLLEKKFAFKIEVTKFNPTNLKYRYYTVSRMTDDALIITKLEEKMLDEEGSQNESVNQKHIENLSEGSDVNLKDSVSFTSENATPLSLTNGPLKDESSDENRNMTKRVYMCDSKRNLNEVHDIGDSPCQSSTKVRRPAEEDVNDVPKSNMLIPKLEK